MATAIPPPFGLAALQLDVAQEVERLTQFLCDGILHKLHRRGAVVGCSGGIDSSVVLALCARALGPERVVALLMPERESSRDSAVFAQALADQLGVATVTEDLTAVLAGAGCYRRRDEAIGRLIPEYAPGWAAKISLPGDLLSQGTLNVFYLTVTSPSGEERRVRLPPSEYLEIVAASNMKQRARMAMLYYHAEARSFAVVGTAPKNEYELGFFVKHGDGGVDISPIQHLFKSQVYQLAKYLGVPDSIVARAPTTDTYPGGSTQEEFFYRLPFDVLDTIWLGHERNVSVEVIATELGLSTRQVEAVVADIQRKKRSTEYLRQSAVTRGQP
jgi:NAD+ synthase